MTRKGQVHHFEVEPIDQLDGQTCRCGFTTDATDLTMSVAILDRHIRGANRQRKPRMLETSAQFEHRIARNR